MKITLESTSKIVQVVPVSGAAAVPCRVWEGETASGIKVQALIPRIAASANSDLSQFDAELRETGAPWPDLDMFPLRMVL